MRLVGDIPSSNSGLGLHFSESYGKILEWTYSAGTMSSRVLMVETHRVSVSIDEDLVVLGIAPPPSSAGEEFINVWSKWATNMTKKLSEGRWPLRSGTIASDRCRECQTDQSEASGLACASGVVDVGIRCRLYPLIRSFRRVKRGASRSRPGRRNAWNPTQNCWLLPRYSNRWTQPNPMDPLESAPDLTSTSATP